MSKLLVWKPKYAHGFVFSILGKTFTLEASESSHWSVNFIFRFIAFVIVYVHPSSITSWSIMWSYLLWSKCQFSEFLDLLAFCSIRKHFQLLDHPDHLQAQCWEADGFSLLLWPRWSSEICGAWTLVRPAAVIHSDFSDYFTVSYCSPLTNAAKPLICNYCRWSEELYFCEAFGV